MSGVCLQGSAVMAPGPAPAVRVSISESVPTVSASVTLPSFTLQSFDTAAQAQVTLSLALLTLDFQHFYALPLQARPTVSTCLLH